ncbi:MAG TPA: YdcF family protein [Vicinamibacterales bacterium]|nr:YdcF family protein [Vicinamibacterales bacterium]
MSVVLAYIVGSVYSTPYAVRQLLTGDLKPLATIPPAASPTAIVLLGSGALELRDWNERQMTVLDRESASRVLEAARVYRLVEDGWLISSGGTISNEVGAPTTAAAMRDGLVSLGVPVSRILLEPRSQTTHEEAIAVLPLLEQLHSPRVILVTSDYHMRRSLGAFRAAGIDAVPAIARDPEASLPMRRWLTPSADSLRYTGHVVHEIGGLLVYVARGWWR